jgi:hypothetical protein
MNDLLRDPAWRPPEPSGGGTQAQPLAALSATEAARPGQIETCRVVRDALGRAGISVRVGSDPGSGNVLQLVIENIPSGRRPTVARIMKEFRFAWRYGDGRTLAVTSPGAARGQDASSHRRGRHNDNSTTT